MEQGEIIKDEAGHKIVSLNFNEENYENEQKININNIQYFKKIILPNEQEKNQHNQYLKTFLKKNFFN